ncbi:LysO family transporter [Carboxylicivirga caseinilyticus]|uniref:LysO family transporter n=1 Tax=Carboxylicivirga caseinilyticus TaxID=3417572 RepID=UPI003D34AEA8
MTSYIVIFLFVVGIIIGRQLKDKEKTRKKVDKSVTYAVYLLLFLLGISVGINDDIIQNFSRIGYKALLLTFGAVAGSVLLAKLVYVFFFKRYQDK